jgi:hypothetical protein
LFVVFIFDALKVILLHFEDPAVLGSATVSLG